MTAADVIQLRSIELPMLASDPRVRVVADVELDRLESCEICVCRSFSEHWAPEDGISVGKWRLTYHLRPGGPEHYTDLCGANCGDVELDEVLNLHNCVGVVLHIPAGKVLPSGPLLSTVRTMPCSAMDDDDDRLCQQLLSLREGIAGMRNDGTSDIGRSGFESARIEALTLINNQIESLGRVA